MSANDYGRRLDKLTEALSGSQRDRFRPERVLLVVLCQHWYDEGSLEARDELAEHAIARQATVDQVVAWVAEDARQHGYDVPYGLVLTFHADDPGHCRFDVPWRAEPGRPPYMRLGCGELSWPPDDPRDAMWW